MKVEKGLLYTKEHEWILVEGEVATVGISDFAQHSMGDIVYVELPEVDDEVEQGETFASLESVKAASDIYAPVSGVIVAINDDLDDDPGLVNGDPYGSWMARIQLSNPEELTDLLSDAEYEAFLEEGEA